MCIHSVLIVVVIVAFRRQVTRYREVLKQLEERDLMGFILGLGLGLSGPTGREVQISGTFQHRVPAASDLNSQRPSCASTK